jgi:hypothetical protein
MAEKIERPSQDAEISRKRARVSDYWSAKYGITKQRLADAIKAVGQIPTLQRSHPLKARIAAIRGDLRPNEAELGDILKDATRRSARLKEELAG